MYIIHNGNVMDNIEKSIKKSGECINNVITMEYDNGVLWGSFQYAINHEIFKYLLRSFIYSSIALLTVTRP